MIGNLWILGLVAAVAQAKNIPYDIGGTNITVAVKPHILAANSPFSVESNVASDSNFRKRTSIDTIVEANYITGSSVIPSSSEGSGIYETISQKIKDQSDLNSCDLITDTITGTVTEGYAYAATTTGSNCDTTAQLSTILAAVDKCVNELADGGAVLGCCTFNHGGTWTGQLKLTADPTDNPATSVTC